MRTGLTSAYIVRLSFLLLFAEFSQKFLLLLLLLLPRIRHRAPWRERRWSAIGCLLPAGAEPTKSAVGSLMYTVQPGNSTFTKRASSTDGRMIESERGAVHVCKSQHHSSHPSSWWARLVGTRTGT
uniref:Uncharacterized protein n=1 Tax=Anopheles albimanus TaxID=7167 RepID=A0A182FDC7_ANOAL